MRRTREPVPFFQADPDIRPEGRRLLLIAYHFPPSQASGALRWQKLAREAAERGWGLDVVTLDPADLASKDKSRLSDLPGGARLYGVRRPTLFVERLERLARLAYRTIRPRPDRGDASDRNRRTSTSLPLDRSSQQAPRNLNARARAICQGYDARLDYARDLRWARRAAAIGVSLVVARRHQAVVSCGPPHMAHEAGRLIAERTGQRFVMDLRDPWSLVERLADDIASPVWYRLAKRYEAAAVARAALIVMNTEAACLAMQQAYPEAAERIIAVMNGYDEDELVPPRRSDEVFRIMFAGSVYLDRNPRLLLRAAAITIRDLQLVPSDFRIEFIGHVGSLDSTDSFSIPAMARAEGLEEFVEVTAFRPRRELRELLARAAMLVSLNQDSNLAVPSKIFEYMQYPAWLLALAEKGSATEILLRGTGADVIAPGNTAALAGVLRERYLQYQRGHRPVRLSADSRFSRRSQSTLLFDSLERVVTSTDMAPVEGVLPGGRR